jgi:hypothetical protein
MRKFQAERKKMFSEAQIGFSREQVYPLLCPIREYDWIDGWQCELIASDSGFAEENCIFKTDLPPFGKETWYFLNYILNDSFIAIRYRSNSILRVDFSLIPEEKGCRLHLDFILTATDDSGNEFVKNFPDNHADLMCNRTATLLDYYLKNRTKMKIDLFS